MTFSPFLRFKFIELLVGLDGTYSAGVVSLGLKQCEVI